MTKSESIQQIQTSMDLQIDANLSHNPQVQCEFMSYVVIEVEL